MRPSSSARAAVLAAAMNLVPVASVDVLRFLRVPAIVYVLRRASGRTCIGDCHRPRRRGATTRFRQS